MRWYSLQRGRLIRQLVADALALATVVAAILLASAAKTAIMGFTSLGTQMQRAGSDFSGTLQSAADAMRAIPFVGDTVANQLLQGVGAADGLSQAGVQANATVTEVAGWVSLAIWLPPVLLTTVLWLVPRVRFAAASLSIAKAAARPGGLQLLAARALTTQRLADVLAISPDAHGAIARDERTTIEQLAALELRRAGYATAPKPQSTSTMA